MIRTIGLLELNSIAKGFETADKVVKAAEVDLLFARTICPGKYIILIAGNVGAVESALETGSEFAQQYLVDKLILPSVHPQVIPAINEANEVDDIQDIGVLEFFSVSSAIIAADAAVKSASVDLIEVRLGIGIGGKSFVTMTGNISSVQNAVEIGADTALENGMFVNKAVISGPDKQLLKFL